MMTQKEMETARKRIAKMQTKIEKLKRETYDLEVMQANLRGQVKETEAYNAEMVERVNFMTGQKFLERRDTPYYCSPSSETYWSS